MNTSLSNLFSSSVFLGNNSGHDASNMMMNSANNNPSALLARAYNKVDNSESWVEQWPFPNYDNQHPAKNAKSTTQPVAGTARPSSAMAVDRPKMNSTTTSNNCSPPTKSFASSCNKVTATEFAVIRSLFGRGEDAHGSAADAPTKLLPHVDLRWLTGALQNNKINYASTMNGNNSANSSGNGRFQENTASSTNPPPTAAIKNIDNLFGNIEAVSNNWTRRDYTSLANSNSTCVNNNKKNNLPTKSISSGNGDPHNHHHHHCLAFTSSLAAPAGSAHALILINSPRSAVTLLRTGTDLHVLVNQVAAAHSISASEARLSSATMQRITSDSDHQHLARQRRRQLLVQEQVHATLRRLAAVYRAVCDTTTWSDIFALRDAEGERRLIRAASAHPDHALHRAMHSERSVAALSRKAEAEMSGAKAVAELHWIKQAKIEDANERKKHIDAERQRAEGDKAVHRNVVHHSQMRSRVLSDIVKRESAALQCQKVYNLDRKW